MAPRAEWLDTDYYAVLGVAEDATAPEITKAYRRLARELHPDARPGDASAESRFKEVSAAYDVLGDPTRRAEYDAARRGRVGGNGPFHVHVRRPGMGDVGDVDDLFAAMFGPRQRRTTRRRGSDVEADVTVTLEEAVAGTTTPIRMPDGRTVRVRVPAGVADGQVIRAAGKGSAGVGGGEAGDLRVRVHVAAHRRFGRRGRDLTVTVPVTYPEAVLGAEVKVPTIDGDAVTVRIPPGTPSGRTIRVRGRGVPTGRGGRGDLLVTVEVAVPRHVTGDERRCVEALAGAMAWNPREDTEVAA